MIADIDNLNLSLQEQSDEYQRLLAETKDYLALKSNPFMGPPNQDTLLQSQ